MINKLTFKQRLQSYKRNKSSLVLFLIVNIAALLTIAILIYIIGYILVKGTPHVITEISNLFNNDYSLFDLKYSSNNVSLMPAAFNTLVLTLLSVSISTILGVITAIYLVEYAKKGSKIVEIIRVTSETLSGIPSIVYGLFGSLFFVKFCGMGLSLLSGCLTISIMILPLVIRSTEEALKSVPTSFREGSFGLGAGKLRTVFTVVLPSAINGILAGVILAIGRVVGESAALLYTSGITTGAFSGLDSGGRTLAIHMYMLSGEGMHIDQTYATAVVLLIIVLAINGLSNLIAKKLTKEQ